MQADSPPDGPNFRFRDLGGPESLQESSRSTEVPSLTRTKWFFLLVGAGNFLFGLFLLGRVPAGTLEQSTLDASSLLSLAVGVSFIVLGLFINRFPLPATLLGLCLYLSLTAQSLIGLLPAARSMVPFVLIIRLLIVFCLFRSFRAALKYQIAKRSLEDDK
jgi:hypothetical protein